MKKICVLFAVLVVLSMFSATALAATRAETKAVDYYDESGNPITIDGVYYDAQGFPCFNAGCYYYDDGKPVYVGGCRVYYYDKNGDLVPGRYCYDSEGSAITPPASYRGGCGYGTWCYGADGTVENGAFYYDDFGNPVNPPAQSTPRYGREGGCCGGGGRGGRWR